MILKFREKMKNTVVIFIVAIFFIVPMVLTGMGDSFLGSAAGQNVASVGDTKITAQELNRTIYMQRQRILAQEGVDPDADYLKDENLRGPAMTQLTRRAALLESLHKGGMSVTEEELNKTILDQEQFYIDGKFNKQAYRRILSSVGYTPTTYKSALKQDMLLSQLNAGLVSSSFNIDEELNSLVGLIYQERSFDVLTISQSSVNDLAAVTDEEIKTYYDSHQSEFMNPEQMTVEYIELAVADVASTIEIPEEAVKEAFDAELASFDSSTEYRIAHILVDASDKETHDKKVKDVSEKLASGEAFDSLVKDYSDDKFSLPLNGDLGILDPEAYSSEFNDAVYALAEGEVSSAVETDLGTHFVKLISKTESEAPVFEDRKVAITNALRDAEAEELYVEKLEQLKELVYGSENLAEPAEALGLTVEVSPSFTRTSGVGVASEKAVRDASFKAEVFQDGYNSDVLELDATRAIVLRKKDYVAAAVKPLSDVNKTILANLEREKRAKALQDKANEIIAEAKAGKSLESFVSDELITFNSYVNAKNTSADVDPEVLSKVFALDKVESVDYSSMQARSGDYKVIALSSVKLGKAEDLPEVQANMIGSQLRAQNSRFESSSFEEAVILASKIKIY